MAVQAQHLPSNAFCSDFPSRFPICTVVEDIQTMPMPMPIQRLPPLAKLSAVPNASVFSDHPQSELTCNVSACRKRRRVDCSSNLPAPAAALPLISPLFDSSPINPSLGFKNSCSVIPASYEQSLPVLNSCVTSTSGRPSEHSSRLAPVEGCFGADVDSLLSQHDLELAAYIGLQFDVVRLGVEEKRKKFYKSMYSIFKQLLIKRFREKETELENAKQKNAELEEKVREMNAERQSWFNVAKNNELLVSNLKSNLEQLLFQNALQDAVIPSLKEGYGDSDEEPLVVDDEQYFCFGADVHMRAAEPVASWPFSANEVSLNKQRCKVCGVDELSTLVLPCRHLCLCDYCDSFVAVCPVCNHPKDSSLQVLI